MKRSVNMSTSGKSFADFIDYRWNSFYKPLVAFVFFGIAIATIIFGLVMGASQVWELITKLDRDIVKIILPIISVSLLIIVVEYTAYRNFMKTPLVKDYESYIETPEIKPTDKQK